MFWESQPFIVDVQYVAVYHLSFKTSELSRCPHRGSLRVFMRLLKIVWSHFHHRPSHLQPRLELFEQVRLFSNVWKSSSVGTLHPDGQAESILACA